MEIGSLPPRQYSNQFFKKTSNFKRETLYIRYVNNKCFEFLKMLNENENETYCEVIFYSSKAKELTSIFKNFLQVKVKCKFQNISKLKFKYFDVNNVEILEEQLDKFLDLYIDPDSYEFDEEYYELNIDIKFPSFRELLKLVCLFNDKIKKEQPIINWNSESESD